MGIYFYRSNNFGNDRLKSRVVSRYRYLRVPIILFYVWRLAQEINNLGTCSINIDSYCFLHLHTVFKIGEAHR